MKPEIKYQHHRISKGNGHYRHIFAPSEELKDFQNRILKKLYQVDPHPSNHGFIPNRSIATNAQLHTGKRFVLSLDIKSFFPNTKTPKVEQILTRFFPDQLENLPWLIYKKHLPQGAPTSPYLANFALYDFDQTTTEFCKIHNISYTRYADDLTFSYNNKVNTHLILKYVNPELRKYSYWLSKKKTHLMPYWRRQKVTGLVVNEKVNLPFETRNQIRAFNHLNNAGKWNKNDMEYLAGMNGFKGII